MVKGLLSNYRLIVTNTLAYYDKAFIIKDAASNRIIVRNPLAYCDELFKKGYNLLIIKI
jgi:hypothetical protein